MGEKKKEKKDKEKKDKEKKEEKATVRSAPDGSDNKRSPAPDTELGRTVSELLRDFHLSSKNCGRALNPGHPCQSGGILVQLPFNELQ